MRKPLCGEQAFVADTEQFEGRKLSPAKPRWYVDHAKAFGDLRLREPDLARSKR
jgi:hypothetical protein